MLISPENNNEPLASSDDDMPRTEFDVVVKSPSLLNTVNGTLNVRVVFAS